MTEGKCHYCENIAEVWSCWDCKELTCEDCFAPMSHMATDPVTPCLECDGQQHRAREDEHQRESDRLHAETERKGRRNKAARARYWKPENIRKRREAAAKRKRERAEQNIKLMVESLKIVGGMMR